MDSITTRRGFVAGSAFSIVSPHLVRGAAPAKLRAGIVGCGGRGTQAVTDMLVGTENVELVAMGDVFEDKLEGSLKRLREGAGLKNYANITVTRNGQPKTMTMDDLMKEIPGRVQVAPENHFTGFDAFKKVINSGVDIVMLTTPPGYRPEHFEAAINAGKHVFTEKPIATDPVGCRRFMAAAKLATEKKLSVVSGAQRHAQKSYVETVDKIKSGAIGEIQALYSRYLSGPVFHAKGRDADWGDMEWQHRNWYSFAWICGDQIVEQHFHNIDFICWVMGTHPSKVVASGGISWRKGQELYGNIYDHMASEFEFANGVRYTSHCRQYPQGCFREVTDMVVGSKGKSTGVDLASERGINPYVQEHTNLVNSIRGTGPYQNQGMSIAESTMTCIMARESAYSGEMVTWDRIMASQLDLQPKAFDYKLKMADGEVPQPGKYKLI
ncbi:MAG TPA: Gfo/Idh/MocA family oxidoreductase [Bryobacteraceae bacterium]|nr:Gfo/Idh/MocA family oxidoreductase [Bryobacteraceae bacterium]HPT25200.1 Gfo/Idh/MocA family oxidoreductase [Bryobacteraceae bacterium]